MGISCGLLAFGLLVSLVGSIWLIVIAFRTSVMWGLAVMFVPFASLVFIIQNWDIAKKPFLISIVGGLLVIPSMSSMDSMMNEQAADTGSYDEDEYYDEYYDEDESDGEMSGPIESAANEDSLDTEIDLQLEGVTESSLPQQVDRSTRRNNSRNVTDRPPLTLETADSYIGVYVVVTKKSGQRVRGYLLDVNPDQLTLEQVMGGGRMTLPLRRSDVAKIAEP